MSNIEVNTDGIVSQKRKLSKYIFEELGYPKSEKINIEDNTLITEGFVIEGYKIKYNIEGKVLDFSGNKVDYHTENVVKSTKLIELYNKLKDKFDIQPSITNIVDSTKATRISPFKFKEEECEIYKAVEYLEITKDKNDIYNIEDVKTIESKVEKVKNSCKIEKEKSVDCEIENVYNKNRKQQIPNIKKECKTMITILRDLKEKVVNAVEETRAVKSMKEKIEKIKDRAIYSTWDIKWFGGKYGVELVVNEDGHLDVYLCAMETYASKIRYYLVGNYQNEFKCGDAIFPNGERREYKRLGTMLNALAGAYEEYEFYFPKIDRKLTSEITKACEKQYNLSRGIGINELLDNTLNELSNAEDSKIVDALISTFAKGDLAYEDDDRVYEVYSNRNTALGIELLEKVKLALEIQLVKLLKKEELDERMMEVYSRLRIDRVELDKEIIDKFDILRFAIKGKDALTIEDFQIECDWNNVEIDEVKIGLFEKYNIKVDIVGDELIMFDPTEQIDGQVCLCEYEHGVFDEEKIEEVKIMSKEKINKRQIGTKVETLAEYVADELDKNCNLSIEKQTNNLTEAVKTVFPNAIQIDVMEDALEGITGILATVDADYTGAKPTKKQLLETDSLFGEIADDELACLNLVVDVSENTVVARVNYSQPYYDKWYNREYAEVLIKESKEYIIDEEYQKALVYKDDVFQKYRRGSLNPLEAITLLKDKLSETGHMRCKELYENNIEFFEETIKNEKEKIIAGLNEVADIYNSKGSEESGNCLNKLKEIRNNCPDHLNLELLIRTMEHDIKQKEKEKKMKKDNSRSNKIKIFLEETKDIVDVKNLNVAFAFYGFDGIDFGVEYKDENGKVKLNDAGLNALQVPKENLLLITNTVRQFLLNQESLNGTVEKIESILEGFGVDEEVPDMTEEDANETVRLLEEKVKNLERMLELEKEKEKIYEEKINDMKEKNEKLESRVEKAERVVADMVNIGNYYLDLGRIQK
ncbi:hypothetical protein UT300009_30500 [Paraclostridium bifermentans]